MYVQGVSTQKVKAITETLCGVEISAAQVSHASAQLDATLQEWRERLLGEITYLYLDARYEKVREVGQVWMQLFWWLLASRHRAKGRI